LPNNAIFEFQSHENWRDQEIKFLLRILTS
jgi:hypothetical protein